MFDLLFLRVLDLCSNLLGCCSRNESYKLDSFFGQEDDNVDQIFHKEVRPLIPGIFHGCNATVFAYGATGSGKTHTMQVLFKETHFLLLGLFPSSGFLFFF